MATTIKAPARVAKTPAWERPVRLTALHREHLAHGATLVERDGWLLPTTYGDAAAEAAALRDGVGLLDIGEGGKIDLKSGNLDAALAAAFPNIGEVAVNTAATIDASTQVYRLTAGHALILTAPAAAQSTLEGLGTAVASLDCTHVTDLTSALAGLRLAGPKAPALLELLTSVDYAPDRFADGMLAQAGIARAHAIVARRDSGGVPGYDIYVDRDLGAYLWEMALEQGAALGIRPVGRDVALS